MAASDILAFNVYGPLDDEWTGSARLGRIVAKIEELGLGEKPRIICEVNQVNFAEFCRYASTKGIERAYWFLWRSAGDDHRILDLYNPEANPKIGDRWILGLAEYMAEEENGGSPPMPQTLADQFPVLYSQWVEAGGDPEEAFRYHLLGIGALPATTNALSKLCDAIKSRAEQAKMVGLRLPKA